MSELKAYTEEELAEHQQLYDEVFTPVWESEGQYCRAGGGQYEKSFAWWAFKHQQSKVDELNQELHLVLNNWNDLTNAIHARTNGTAVAEARQLYEKVDELQKRVDALEKAKFKLAQVKAIIEKNPKLLESILVKKIEQALKGGEA